MKPKVLIENEVYRKIMHWVNKSPYEVSGLGTLVVEKDGWLRVTDAMLLPQKNGAAHTDIEADAICKALYELRDAPGEVKFWWHSHVKMQVFWSNTDHQAMRDFASTPDSWMLATVFNQREELRSAFYAPAGIDTPWGGSELFYDELETQIAPIVDEKSTLWDAEYEKNVTNIQPRNTGAQVFNAQTGQWEPLAPGLSKKERKRLKKITNDALAKAQEQAVKPDPDLVGADQFSTDINGFDIDELTLLEHAGFTDDDVNELADRDFNTTQILLIAEAGLDVDSVCMMLDELSMTPLDVMRRARHLVDQAKFNQDIAEDDAPTIEDDLPVADRRHGLGYGDLQ